MFRSVTVLPKPWVSIDIGHPLPGFSLFREGQFAMTASGSGIEGRSDSGHFVCQPLVEDGTISAQVIEITNGTSQAMAGIMFRANPNADSAHVFMSFVNKAVYQLQHRQEHGAETTVDAILSNVTAPYFMKLEKEYDVYSAYVSTDGIMWSLVDSISLDLGDAPLACLASTSSEEEEKIIAMYQRVSVVPIPWKSFDMGNPLSGFTSFDGRRYVLTASGDGIGGTSDSAHFVCQRLIGDGSITAPSDFSRSRGKNLSSRCHVP